MSVGHRQATKEAAKEGHNILLPQPPAFEWQILIQLAIYNEMNSSRNMFDPPLKARILVTQSEWRKQKHGPEVEKKKFDKRRIRLVLHDQQVSLTPMSRIS